MRGVQLFYQNFNNHDKESGRLLRGSEKSGGAGGKSRYQCAYESTQHSYQWRAFYFQDHLAHAVSQQMVVPYICIKSKEEP